MPGPLVTAVIPLHNHAKWIGDAMTSIDTQDYEKKTLVVVDDGSSDNSLAASLDRLLGVKEVLVGKQKAWTGQMPCGTETVVTRFEKASGPSFARNRGMELAVGIFKADIFAFLDSDDFYEQGKISKSVARFQDPNVGVVYSDYDTLRPDGLRVREFKEAFSRERLVRECIVNCDSLVSAKAIQACDGFDESLRVVEDYDAWLRLSERYLIVHVAESLVTIRVGMHSSTASVRSEVWNDCWRRVMEKAQQRSRGNTKA